MKDSKNNFWKALINATWVIAGLGFLFLLISAKDITTGKAFAQINVSVQELEDGFYMIEKETLEQELQKIYGEKLRSQNLGDIEIQKIEAFLEKDGFVRNAEVYVSPNRTLHINLEQRQPIARVLSAKSGNFYIDADGLKMPLSKLHAVRCVVISGHLPLLKDNDTITSTPIGEKVFEFCKAIYEDEFMESFIDEIHVESDGTLACLPKIGDFVIKISHVENLENKFDNLKLFLKEVVAKNNWDKYSEINIDFDNQIIAKKNNN